MTHKGTTLTLPPVFRQAGILLRMYRESKAISHDITEKFKFDKSYLSMVEHGKRHPSRLFLERLFEALDLEPRLRDAFIIAFGYATEDMARLSQAQLFDEINQLPVEAAARAYGGGFGIGNFHQLRRKMPKLCCPKCNSYSVIYRKSESGVTYTDT